MNFGITASGRNIQASTFGLMCLSIWKYYLLGRILGLTFALKLMENGEEGAQRSYYSVSNVVTEAATIAEEENGHEKGLINMIDEEKLQYVGSMVLGLNDALVELTGALAGFTFALANPRLVATAGFITGHCGLALYGCIRIFVHQIRRTGKEPP